MSLRVRVALVMMWLTSLFAVGALASGQTFQLNPLPEAIVLSGGDIGFRVQGWLGNAPAGQLVIRLNGQWVEPEFAARNPVRPIR